MRRHIWERDYTFLSTEFTCKRCGARKRLGPMYSTGQKCSFIDGPEQRLPPFSRRTGLYDEGREPSCLGDEYAVSYSVAQRAFPEAFVHFDFQCSDLVHERIKFRLYRKSGTYAQGKGGVSRDRLLVVIDAKQFVWHPNACVWVRASFGVKTTGK